MDGKNIFDINVREFQPPRISGRLILSAVVALFLLIALFASFYQIEPEEVGVVLRFGRYVRTTDPGLHAKIPFAETVLKVPVQRQLKQEFGFRTIQAGVRTRYSDQKFLEESLMLTGDLNVAVVEWIVQYRVSDPFKYLFRVRNVEETFRNMTEAMMRLVIGDRTVTEVLTVGRQEIEVKVLDLLQDLCNQYETGITVDQVVLQDVTPPDPVKPSWDEVNQAQQQRDRLINDAQAEYNELIPRARGEAQQAVLQAEGYGFDRTNRAEGDASRFKALYEAYRRAPEVTRKRLYFETMQKVLPKWGGKLMLDGDAEGVLPLLPLEALQKSGLGKPQGGGQ
ncbi:MAG: FtsH protease activity modulator HflK [Acidobacteriota bacterium]